MSKPFPNPSSWRGLMRLMRFARSSQPTRHLPQWCFWSLTINLAAVGASVGIVAYNQLQPDLQAASPDGEMEVLPVGHLTTAAHPHPTAQSAAERAAMLDIGPRHRLNYQDWLTLLEQEAIAAGQDQTVQSGEPAQLTVLLGDSISLWFPPQLLSHNRR